VAGHERAARCAECRGGAGAETGAESRDDDARDIVTVVAGVASILAAAAAAAGSGLGDGASKLEEDAVGVPGMRKLDCGSDDDEREGFEVKLVIGSGRRCCRCCKGVVGCGVAGARATEVAPAIDGCWSACSETPIIPSVGEKAGYESKGNVDWSSCESNATVMS